MSVVLHYRGSGALRIGESVILIGRETAAAPEWDISQKITTAKNTNRQIGIGKGKQNVLQYSKKHARKI